MNFFSNPQRSSAPLLLRSLQSYLDGFDPHESAIVGGSPPSAAANLAELRQIRRTSMEGCVPVSAGEAVRHVFDSVSPNLSTEATSVTTVALPDAAAWHLCGRPNASVAATSGISGTRASSSPSPPTIAANCLAVNGGGAKVGKKRSRASRRAPTTLLNTDTSNFRAMVQQFTGISNAPFAYSGDSPAQNSPPRPFAQRLLGQSGYAAKNSNSADLVPPLRQHSSLPIFPFQSFRAENMNNPFLLSNFFGNKGGAFGISEGQFISTMNDPAAAAALSFGPT